MAEVALHLEDLSAPDLLATGSRLLSGLDGNPNFPEPRPPLDEVRHRLGTLENLHEEYRKVRLRLNELKTERDAAMKEVRDTLMREAAYVQEASGGDAKKIVSAHLTAERTWSWWPFGSLAQVIEFSASTGEQPGEVDLVWDPVHDADGYEVECSDDASGGGTWLPCAVAPESRVTVTGLAPRRRYWFRVRATGGKGKGDWSDPITKYSR